MIVDPHYINKTFLECDEVIDIDVYFSFGNAENAQGELCPNPTTISSIKGFVSVTAGLSIVSATFSKGTWNTPVIDAGSMITDEELEGIIRIDVGDTCYIPGSVSIKWRGYDEDGEVCLEHLMQYNINADLTCCKIQNCFNTKLTCD